MPDPYAEFQQPAAADPYAEFSAPIRARPVAPLGDYSPLQEAYTERQQAIATGAPKNVVEDIDARINKFTGLMQDAEAQRQLEKMGAGGRFLAGAGQGLTNVAEHAKELSQQIFPFKNREENLQKFTAERKAAEQEAQPLLETTAGGLGNLVGEAAGTAPIALATGGAGMPVLESTLAGAGMGALLSEPDQRMRGAVGGGLAGLATGAAGKAIGGLIKGPIQPSPAAKQLQALGVEGLTAGQANPTGPAAHFEHAAESIGLFGPSVKNARDQAAKNLEQRILDEATPPGFASKLPAGASALEKIKELQQAFGAGYNSLLDELPVPKQSIQDSLLNAVYGPTQRALSSEERKTAVNVVVDQASKLDNVNSLRTLGDIRSNILAEARDLARTKPTLSKHLKDVASVVSGHIEGAMKANPDPEAYGKWRALNEAFSKFAVVRKAAGRDLAGEVSITPDSLSRAILRDTTPEKFAQGAGGNLRVLARAGKQTLSPPRPTTGALEGVFNLVPVLGKWGVGASGYLTSHYPRAFMGQTLPQRVLQQTLGRPGISDAFGQLARAGLVDWSLPEDEQPVEPELPQPKVLARTLKGR